MTQLACLVDVSDPRLAAAVDSLVGYLRRSGVDVVPWPADSDATLVWCDRASSQALESALLDRLGVRHPVLLAGPSLAAWRDLGALVDATGVLPGRETPVHEVRLRSGPDARDVTHRMGEPLLVHDRWLRLDKVLDDVEVLLTANHALADHPVMTWRPATAVGVLTLGSIPDAVAEPALQRLVHRWLRRATGRYDGPPVRVGLLGYGAIGHEHSAAIAATEGLTLAAVCDRSPDRVAAARRLAPDVSAYASPGDLLADDLDVVVVSTPPNTHAEWAMQVLAEGKHCVVEKPFALSVAEADAMAGAARDRGLALAVYQNRRWDPDYLALRRVVRSGAIGEVFHYESFVGSYGHPCNYWHSDEEISGGAIYDWGSHFIDWVLDLLPQDVEHVTAAAHKRVWHDVTNADHSRVTVRFVDGVEAEFVHSDLAAALKPKWYVLGTRGAVVGDWRRESVLSRSPIGTLLEDRLAAADAPATLSVHLPDGSVTSVALPEPPAHPFHRELADLLLSGEPMSVTPEGSRRNVAVMEAATVSAREGGRPVTLP